MLQSCSTGSECWKNSPGSLLHGSVIPLLDCRFISPVKKAKSIINEYDILSPSTNNSIVRNQPTGNLNTSYIQASFIIKALNFIRVEKFHYLRSKELKIPIENEGNAYLRECFYMHYFITIE